MTLPTRREPQASYTTYRWLKNEDFTAFGHHYGGNILKWAEEEAGIFATRQLGTFRIATVAIANVTFPNALGKHEDLLKLDIVNVAFGATSLRFGVTVSSASTGIPILEIGQVTFANLNEHGATQAHGYTHEAEADERLIAFRTRQESLRRVH